jgi:transposase
MERAHDHPNSVTPQGLVESRMRWKPHVRFGGRAGETDHWKQRHGAPARSHHANSKLDECRRRVQQETLGHRGRCTDPLYRSRRLLTRADERLDEVGRDKLVGLLEAGDPRGEVRLAWHAKETIRGIYALEDPTEADAYLTELADDMTDPDHPVEVRSLGRTLRRWHDQIVAWHRAHVSNGPTEALNNLIKRIKRIGFGFRRFAHYRLRVLLYAGRPNWDLLTTIDPAQIR